MNQLPIVTTIKQVYPGIEDELCNRHSVHLTRIKHKFQYLYNQYQPMVYVIAKGLCSFTQSPTHNSNQHQHHQLSSYMAIQNGIIIAIAKTKQKQSIYINYNKWETQAEYLEQQLNKYQIQTKQQLQEQLILTYKGEIQSLPQLSKQTQDLAVMLGEVYGLAVGDLSLGKIMGGVVYVDGRLEDGCFWDREALVWAFYVAILQLNGLRQQYTAQDILTSLQKYYQKTHKNLHSLLTYTNILNCQPHTLTINNTHHVTPKTSKFVICKLIDSKKFKKNKQKSQLLDKLRGFQQQQIGLFGSSKIGVEELCGNMKFCLNQLQISHQSEDVYQFMQKYIVNSMGFLVTQHNQYIAILSPTHRIPDLIAKLTKQLKPTLTSPVNNHNPGDILQKQVRKYQNLHSKWNSSKNIDQFVFSTLGCVGLSVLDPKEQLWYCQ